MRLLRHKLRFRKKKAPVPDLLPKPCHGLFANHLLYVILLYNYIKKLLLFVVDSLFYFHREDFWVVAQIGRISYGGPIFYVSEKLFAAVVF